MVCGALRLSLNRLARTHWAPGRTLRSWGAVPLVRRGARLLAPCAPDEALWLGAWRDGDDDPGQPVRLSLVDPVDGVTADLLLPPGYQITTLGRGPIACDGAARALRLDLPSGIALPLELLPTAQWVARTGRRPPAPLTVEPPLPPRLG